MNTKVYGLYKVDYLERNDGEAIPKELECQITLCNLFSSKEKAVDWLEIDIIVDRDSIDDFGKHCWIDGGRVNDSTNIPGIGVTHYSYSEAIGEFTRHRYYAYHKMYIS